MYSSHPVGVLKGQIMFTSKSSRVVQGAVASAVCLALAFGTAGVALAGQGSHSRDHSNISSHDHGPWNDARGTVSDLGLNSLIAVIAGARISAVGLPGSTADSLNANSVNIWAPHVSTHARGTVSDLGLNSITLTDRHGTSTTYTTTGTTAYFEGTTAGFVGELAKGEQVNLELTSTSPQTVTKVTIDLVRYFGQVSSVVGNVITITAFHNTTLTVNVSGTTAYTSDGAPSSLIAVIAGARISAVGLPGSTADSLNANSVNIDVASNHGSDHGHHHGHHHAHDQGLGHGKGLGHGRH